MMSMNNIKMPSDRISALKREEIVAAARSFRWNRQMPKWSVIVEGRELPARPLVLDAAGVPPNDPTNSHQAVAILEERGFDVRYQGKAIQKADDRKDNSADFEELLTRLRGSLKGPYSLLEDREREHRIEKDRWPQ
jgi:hypothetical protein